MTKKTSPKEAAVQKTSSAKKKTNLAGFAPKRASVTAQGGQQADAHDDAPAPAAIGPRGGRTASLADRAVAISFRVSKEQYRKLCEARLDANTTTQGLMLLALGKYFQTERRSAF